MRITPINMAYSRQNLNYKKQSPSFGTFEKEEIEKPFATEVLEIEKDDTGSAKEALEYFRNKPFVTIKCYKDKDGKNFFYAVANKEAMDKHENKDEFDSLIEIYESYREVRYNRPARDAGIIDAEPNFLEGLPNFTVAHNVYENLWKAETGYKPTESASSNSTGEYDNFSKALDHFGTRI